jgi:hypothetical protein
MGTSRISRARRIAGMGAGAIVLVLACGAGPAAAGDQHSGGVSPNQGSSDPGNPPAEVSGGSASRGGLPVTGADIAGAAVIGAAAVAAGSGAIALSRRRGARIST